MKILLYAPSAGLNLKNNKFTYISLFCGCGGSSLGYNRAGYTEKLAIDFNKNAVETFKLNFNSPTLLTDITKVDIKQLKNEYDLENLYLLDGSPPCQGFSINGKCDPNDSRNDLFLYYLKFLNELQPKTFIMENVTGILSKKMSDKFNFIIKNFKDTNYNFKIYKLFLVNFGVPQIRKRIFFIGIRKDFNVDFKLKVPYIPIKKTYEYLKDVCNTKEDLISALKVPPKIMKYLKNTCVGNKLSKIHYKNNFFNYIRIHKYKPIPTICKGRALFHYKENRFLTIPELKVFAGFPNSFKMAGSANQQWQRLGNAVPPAYTFEIGKQLKDLDL